MPASVRLSGARPSYRIGVAATREETQSRINDNILETAKQTSVDRRTALVVVDVANFIGVGENPDGEIHSEGIFIGD